MATWFAMGGYAVYVWPAYAVFFMVLAIDWIAPALRRRTLIAELRGRIAREAVRHANAVRAQAETSA